MNFELNFRPGQEVPDTEGDYLLYNQCDGYHIAEAWFVDGAFCGFYFWPNEHVSPRFYCAWAKLPDTTKELYEAFAEKRTG